MEFEEVEQLFLWVNALIYRDKLDDLSLFDYPHLKTDYRRKIHKALYKKAYPEIMGEEGKALTLEDLARMGNG